jgi:hypothetical protein
MIRGLIALIAIPFFLIVAVLSMPYYAIVTVLKSLRLIPKEPAPAAVWWGDEESSVVEISVPFTKPEIAATVVTQIVTAVCSETGVASVRHVFNAFDEFVSCDDLAARFQSVVQSIEYGSTAESSLLFGSDAARVHIDWMNEQGTFIAMVELFTRSFDPRALMEQAVESVSGLVEVRRHLDG